MVVRRAVPNVFDWGWNRCNVRFCFVPVHHAFDCNVTHRNTDCDYSSAYVSIYTDSELVGHGMTFTIGRGNDIVSAQPFIFPPCSTTMVMFS